jgi:ketosteroid isomerase-like protein
MTIIAGPDWFNTALESLRAGDVGGSCGCTTTTRVREAGDELTVEATGRGRRPGSGEPFHLQYVWFITHKNRRVSRFRDYMNPRHRSA